MPINPDGTISAPLQRYVTRVLLEVPFTSPDVIQAVLDHTSIVQTIDAAINEYSSFGVLADILDGDINLTYAKTPTAVPEGEGQDGGLSCDQCGEKPGIDFIDGCGSVCEDCNGA